jgi:hypothetical protein
LFEKKDEEKEKAEPFELESESEENVEIPRTTDEFTDDLDYDKEMGMDIDTRPSDAADSPSNTESKQDTSVEDFFSDDIFSQTEDEGGEQAVDVDILDETESESKLDDQSVPYEPEISIPPVATEPVVEEATAESVYPAQEEKVDKPLYSYESFDADDKQGGINYKPVLIGISIVAAIVIIFFVVSNLFFGTGGEEINQPKVETAAEKLQREQAEKKQSFLSEISKSTNHRLGSIQLLANLDNKNIKYSSILLYGNSLDLEVFAPNREALAKFNLIIKSNQSITDYKIESVDNRPGSTGGLFALYDINLAKIKTASSASTNQVNPQTPQTWASNFKGLTVSSQRDISSKKENLFTVRRREYEFRGSFINSLSLVNQLATSNQNIAVRKLSLLPTDQRKMSSSSYMMKMIVDFYL